MQRKDPNKLTHEDLTSGEVKVEVKSTTSFLRKTFECKACGNFTFKEENGGLIVEGSVTADPNNSKVCVVGGTTKLSGKVKVTDDQVTVSTTAPIVGEISQNIPYKKSGNTVTGKMNVLSWHITATATIPVKATPVVEPIPSALPTESKKTSSGNASDDRFGEYLRRFF